MADPCGDYSLACRACSQKFAKWQRQIEVVRHEVGWLVHDHQIFLTVTQMMDAAELPALDGTFYTWMGTTYQETVALRVRRLLDTDKGTDSLGVVLSDIAANSKVLSRERLVALYIQGGNSQLLAEAEKENLQLLNDRLSNEAGGVFDRVAGKGEQFLPPQIATSDLAGLSDASQRMKDVADKVFAHIDKQPPTEVPTWGEADECVELLEETTRRYSALLLIRLLQETSICSVRACRVRRSRPASSSFSGSSPTRRRASSTWRRAAGRTAFSVHAAATAGPTRWAGGGGGNAQRVATRCR